MYGTSSIRQGNIKQEIFSPNLAKPTRQSFSPKNYLGITVIWKNSLKEISLCPSAWFILWFMTWWRVSKTDLHRDTGLSSHTKCCSCRIGGDFGGRVVSAGAQQYLFFWKVSRLNRSNDLNKRCTNSGD